MDAESSTAESALILTPTDAIVIRVERRVLDTQSRIETSKRAVAASREALDAECSD
jgi:hypothetical protein